MTLEGADPGDVGEPAADYPLEARFDTPAPIDLPLTPRLCGYGPQKPTPLSTHKRGDPVRVSP
jgi:hypothetical protein